MAQAQPMQQPAPAAPAAPAAPVAKPMAPAAKPMVTAQPTGMPGQGAPKSGWLKWLIITLVIVLVVGGIVYWIFAP